MPRSPEQQAAVFEESKTIEELWDPDNWPPMVKYRLHTGGRLQVLLNVLPTTTSAKISLPDWERRKTLRKKRQADARNGGDQQ